MCASAWFMPVSLELRVMPGPRRVFNRKVWSDVNIRKKDTEVVCKTRFQREYLLSGWDDGTV